MKRKWWIAAAVGFSAVILGLIFFREVLMVRLFPKVVLSNAITSCVQQLEERFQNSPVRLLSSALDSEGCQDISMKLDTSTQLLGIAHYSMDFHTQSAPNRIYGKGSVSTGAGRMELDLYLDESCAAVSSPSLTEGTYYGITYDTFHQDIRGFELFTLLAGEEILIQWEESLDAFQEKMQKNYTFPKLSLEDVRAALFGALALKPRVQAGGGKGMYTVAFRAAGSEIAAAAEPYLDQVPDTLAELIRALAADDNSSVNMVFCLEAGQLSGLDAGLSLADASYQITVDFGKSALRDPIALEVMSYAGDTLQRMELTVETLSDDEAYQEGIQVRSTVNGVQTLISADYTWDLSSGDLVMDFVRDGTKYPIRLNLTGNGETVTLRSQEFEQILGAATGKNNSRPSICTLTLSHGERVNDIPDYRNLADWSMEDLTLLLTRLGTLLGIRLP